MRHHHDLVVIKAHAAGRLILLVLTQFTCLATAMRESEISHEHEQGTGRSAKLG